MNRPPARFATTLAAASAIIALTAPTPRKPPPSKSATSSPASNLFSRERLDVSRVTIHRAPLSFAPSLLLCFISSRISVVDPLRELGRMLLVLGVLLVFLGALFYLGGKLPLRLGRLPGDIVHRGEHTTFYFPIVTCLVLSAAFSLLHWLFGHLRK